MIEILVRIYQLTADRPFESIIPEYGRLGVHNVKPFGNEARPSAEESTCSMSIRLIWNVFKGLISMPISQHRSEYYLHIAKHLNNKIGKNENEVMLKRLFGAAFKSTALNIVEDRYTYDDFKCAYKEKEKDFNVNTKNQNLIATSGICKGITIDLAEKFLLKNYSIDDLMDSIKNGASIETEIAQSKYQSYSEKGEDFVTHFFKTIENASEDDLIKSAFSAADEERTKALSLYTDINDIKKFFESELEIKEKLDALSKSTYLFNTTFEEDYSIKSADTDNTLCVLVMAVLSKNTNLVKRDSNGKVVTVDYKEMQKELLKEIDRNFDQNIKAFNKKIEELMSKKPDLEALYGKILQNRIAFVSKMRSQLYQEIKIVMAAKQTASYKSAEDPQMGILRDLIRIRNVKTGVSIAQERGITLQPTEKEMGSSAAHKNDMSYLRNLDQLSPGFYNIDFNTADGGHAISFIIEENNSGCIIDPNYGSFKFDNITESQEIMQKLLHLYPSSPVHESFKDDRLFHNIRIFRCELL